jgi:putative FmdB family regulatory protein
MPIYEYACGDCSEVFSVLRSISAAETDNQCPECGSTNMKKQISSFSCCSVDGGSPSFAPSGGPGGG